MLKPIPCTAKDVASALGLHERRISELTRVGTFQKPYELIACVQAYCRFLREDVGGLRDQRVRVAKLKGDLLQLDYQERLGSLVEEAEIEKIWFTETRRVRDNLFNIPDRVCGLCAAEADQHKIHDLLTAELHQCLEALCEEKQVTA